MPILLLAFIFSYALVAFMLPRILLLSLRKRLFDPIDPRKVHSVPASRLGGVTFFPAIVFSLWSCFVLCRIIPADSALISGNLILDEQFLFELLALLILFMVGIYDDILGVSYRIKFVVQIASASLLIASGAYFQTLHGMFGIYEIPFYIGMPITLFFYVFVTNAINLIDGIDGLASMLSMLALSVYGVLLYLNGQLQMSLIAVTTLGALVPFWYCNVFGIKKGAESKIFMGDTGSLVIGAILGFISVHSWNITQTETGKPIDSLFYILTYTMLLVPCFDVIRVMLHRFRNKRPIFQPDKNHIHHKFMALGLTPRQSLILIVLMCLGFVIVNVALSFVLEFIYIVVIDVLIWSYIHKRISKILIN